MTKNTYKGGYFLIEKSLIRSPYHGHTCERDDPLSDDMLAAINCIQETAWQINPRVLDVMLEAYESGSELGKLPHKLNKKLPTKSEEDWARMTDIEKKEWKKHLSSIHGDNAKLVGQRRSLTTKTTIAKALRDKPCFYYPHFVDFRTRIYPLPTDLTPQSNDIGRGLLRFANGKPLGPGGWRWLCIRLAGCMGFDKEHLIDRVRWVEDRIEDVMDSADNPLDGRRWWADCKEPWSALATCFEITEALSSGDPATYVSYLPIPVDGTCNGLQHFSAMARDVVGAKATNVADNEDRQDIYEEVLKIVAEKVSHDAAAGVSEAMEWAGLLTRDHVKQGVMTTPYGVTSRGIADQIMKKGFVSSMENKRAQAGYLRDRIIEGLDVTIASARGIMEWIQECALVLSRYDIPLEFDTPIGNRITQAYYKITEKRVTTLYGKLVMARSEKASGLDDAKQRTGSAPNLVHSFDAAHLAMTVVEMSRQYKDVSYAMIHDSYGCHAADMDNLSRVIRETFHRIYQTNWLEVFFEEWTEAARKADLVDVVPHWSQYVTMGDFDLDEVLTSEFFFA